MVMAGEIRKDKEINIHKCISTYTVHSHYPLCDIPAIGSLKLSLSSSTQMDPDTLRCERKCGKRGEKVSEKESVWGLL